MSLNTKRLLFVILNCFTFAFLSAQTLYWVGGSGNFNDPSHWSLSSGGSAANQIPGLSTDVIFDDNSNQKDFTLTLNSINYAKSLKFLNENHTISIEGSSTSQLHLKGDFILSPKLELNFTAKLFFDRVQTFGTDANIDFMGHTPNSNVDFIDGNWNLKNFFLPETKTVNFLKGNYTVYNTAIKVGNFVANSGNVNFFTKMALVEVKHKFYIGANTNFNVESTGFKIFKDNTSEVIIDPSSNVSSGKTIGNGNNVISACGFTVTSQNPSCSSSTNGKIFVAIDPTCIGTGTLQFSGGCMVIPDATVTAGNTYTFSNFGTCGTAYGIALISGGIPVAVTVVGMSASPPVSFFPFNSIQPSCFGGCDGSFGAFWSSGNQPYTIVHAPPSQAQYTINNVIAGAYTYTSVCAGVHTFSITDFNGCFIVHTSTLGQPAVLGATITTTSITCNTFSNGAFAVSPTGGTAGYTVNFSNASSQIIGAFGTASVTGLGTGPISATVTDSKGCSINTSTTIIQPSAFNVISTQTNISCNGASNGSAAVQVSGATPNYSFAWSPSSNTSSLASNLGPGSQTVVITDQNSCTTTANFSITQPPAITVTATQTNVVCSGSATGVASITPSGGTGAFSYTWTAPGPPALSGNVPSQSGLLSFAAPYSVTVRDANNCSVPLVTFSITQPPTMTLSIVSRSVSCFGLSDGGATVTATGGNNASYTYTWTPGPFNTTAINGLAAGVYSLTVADASFCPKSTTVGIVQPSLVVTPAVTFTNLTCNVANSPCDGRINASPTGGTPPYSYTLASSTTTNLVTTAPPYNNLCAGNYTVIVRDISGCPQQSVVTLSQPGALTPSISITTPIACFGSSVGGLTGSPSSGGTPTYALTWSTPSGTASGAILTNRPAGGYTLTVTDSKSCTAQTTATLTQPTSMTVAVNTSSISCFATCNGVINSTVSGGTPGYSYAWTNSLSATVGTNATATSLCPGQYTLTVTDAAACTRTTIGTVLSPGPIVLTQTSTPVNCFGDSNGSATVTASGGTMPFVTYNFVSSTTTITNVSGIINGQPSGTFVVTVTDNAACTKTIGLSIGSPTALTAAITGTGSCNVCTGTAAITPSFGTAPYNYLWTSSISGTFATTQTVSGLCPANYTATVTDSKGCTITRTIAISQIVTVTISATPSSILCNGATTGSATATQSGGIPGYTYSWTPSGQTTATLSAVGAGTYTVRVTDSSLPACSHTAAVVLTQPPAITVTATQTNVSCFGFTNGAITTTITGGTGPAYSQTWTPGGLLTTSLSGIGANVYTLNVRDANLCPAVATVSVTEPSSITISLAVTNPTGCVAATANGSICATVSGGSGSGYSYTLTPGAITNTTGCFTGLGGGTYSIIVSDGTGCSNNTFTTLSSPSSPTITASATPVSCFGFSTAIASATATGLTPSFTFSWTPAVTFTTNGLNTITTASNLAAGIYFITATDGNGCISSQSLSVVQAPSVTINSSFNNLTCNNVSAGSISVAPTGGTPTYTYSWLPAASITTGQGTGTVSSLAAGIYTLDLTDNNSCLTSYNFTITQPPAITVTAITSSLSCFNVCTGSIVANASGGTGSLNYSWTPVGGSSPTITGLCANTGTNPASYTLTVTDANACAQTNTYIIVEPPVLTNTVVLLSASCSNSCNAVASQSASGGVLPYSYSWSAGPATTPSIGALCSGTYVATVTDGNNCSFANQFTVTPPSALSVTLTPSNPLCNAACDGSISTIVSGAQGTVAFSWLPAGTGQNPTGLCAIPNPVYTLVAVDQNSCQVTAQTTLINPPAITTTVNTINPLCFNDANGTATVNVSNAIGAISYTWLPTGPPTQTTQTATGLASGVYTVMVKDNNLCEASQTFTLTNPTTITVNTSINPASCTNSNGGITLNPSGGTPGSPTPYTYTWTGVVSSSSVVTGLFAGIYTVQVADGVGCSTTAIIVLSNANGPNVMPITSTSIVCNAQCTGAASVDIGGIIGGTSPYTASWIAPAPSTVNPLTNLCAGTYTAQINDFGGCITFTNVTIAEPPPIILAPSIGLPLCPGICDGTVALNTSGGNAPYSYTWSPISSNSSTLAGLCAGDYTVTVEYNTVCLTTSVISIPDQSSITIVPTVTNNLCFGTCNAIANVSVSGGTSPYNISWSNSQTGPLITGLCNGDYTVSVTDNNGCNNTASTSVTSGPQMTSTTSVVSPSCGLCDGTASVTVTGGTSPLTYHWSNSATTPSLSNMCAGIYQVVVTDALSCSQTHTVVINNSNGITGENIAIQEIPCSGSCTGAATVTAIGGNSPITYNWLSPAVNNSVISNLCPGTYYMQMTDAQSCIRIASITINPLVTLTVSPFVQLPACNSSDGSIILLVAGGTPSYTITWNPPAGNTSSITGINSGVYSYTVTESSTNSCSVSQVINMSNSTGPELASEQRNIDCFDACTGSITVIATSSSTPLSYNWSNGATTPSLTNLCAGVITLTVTDVNGCKTIRSYTITDNPRLRLVTFNVQNPNCAGDCDGVITLNPNGGVFPYTYSWTPVNSTLNPLPALCDGTYSAQIVDSKGCFINSPTFTITSESNIVLTGNTFSSSCSSVADGTINIVTSGGVPEYLFLWQGPSGYTAATQNLANVYSGNYTVTVSDNAGCQTDSVLSVVPSITIVARAGTDNIICKETGSVVIDANASSGGASYKWYRLSDNVNSISNTSSLLVKNLLNPETYVVIATSSVPSCFDSDTVDVNLYPTPFVDAGRDYTVPIYTSVMIGGNPTGIGAVSLTWSPAAFLNDPTISNPIASSTLVTTYTVTMTDVNGCTASDSITVDLYPELNITSGFSPNGDGKNDTWLIDYIDQFPANTVEIYNRWGDRIFSSNGYDVPFDGTYKGKDLPVGTYYYIININHPGYPKPITGPLTIFR